VNKMTPLLQAIDVEVRVDYAPSRPFDVKVNVLDCRLLQSLGWQPNVGIEEGLRRTRDWLVENDVVSR